MQHAELPCPGIKPILPALKTWSLNHWTTREVPISLIFFRFYFYFII